MKKQRHKNCVRGALTVAIALLAITPAAGDKPHKAALANPSFDGGVENNGVPLGWSKYGGGGKNQEIRVVNDPEGRKALLIADGDPSAETGVSQGIDLKGGETYRVTVKVRAVKGVSAAGAYVQLRFLPSNQLVQTDLNAESVEEFSEISVKGTAPPDTTSGVIYLYTHRAPTPQVLVTDVQIVGGLSSLPPPPPAPVPPRYSKLKDLHLDIPLVDAGRPRVAIVAAASGVYAAAATAIQQAIQERTGVQVPIFTDDCPEASVPVKGNLIVLGNRSTNRTMSALYDLYYCLVDLKYPGPEGYVIRTVHNPFGDGHSVVVVGGSDSAGVDAGARVLAGVLSKCPVERGKLSIGWTMETKLGKGLKAPTDIREFETWEASRGYGSSGYFGWCSISKRMAMYYMTGDERSAREVLRLSFPDKQAIRDIEAIDGERIENKRDPLAGFYHYNAHMAILFWDLIEESPLFTDQQRLQITNAFSRQLNRRKGEGVYGLTQPPRCVGTRHGQWSAISLYCLGRYFNKYYPDPIWAQCVRSGELAFGSLHQHAWVAGESDNLFWYNTAIAPIFTYMVLTGDRQPLHNGVIEKLLRGQEALISGRDRDWALNSASLGLLNKAAHVTGDGRWITYRERTGVDTNIFRLGQSFWPDETIQPKAPADLVGKWTTLDLPKPAWRARGNGLPLGQSFYFASFRSAPDASGDFILLDGFNGAARNPYHTFDILQLRLAGHTVLDGYHNQVLASADGMVEPRVAMDAALVYADVTGPTATAVGEVPRAAFCKWRRTIVQRTGRYALVVDDLAFRTDSRNMTVTTTWQVPGGSWDQRRGAIRLPPAAPATAAVELRCCDLQEVSRTDSTSTMRWHGAVNQGDRRLAFYLIGQTDPKLPGALACTRVAENAAAMTLPQPALAVVGKHGKTNAELAVLAENHLYGHGLLSAGIGGAIVSSDGAIDIDWDFDSGMVHVVAKQPTQLRLSLAASEKLCMDDSPVEVQSVPGVSQIQLSEGRHVITGALLDPNSRSEMLHALEDLLAAGRKKRPQESDATGPSTRPNVAELPVALSAHVGGEVVDMIPIGSGEETQLAVAEGNAIHVLTLQGEETRRLRTDGKIRVLRWWEECDLFLVGCVDEKVIAFDRDGRRKWVFTSQMDTAVYGAAKTYWFKSAPGHEGIHGLYTDRFDGGKGRCFVGSACTLEILDQNGQLVKRTPVFWGPGRRFLVVTGPQNTRNLLIARWPNGYDKLAIVNSKTLRVTGHGYKDVPSGHSYVGGWTAQNRTGLFFEDLDGDGSKEVATAVNGTWNRVTVYSEKGRPLYNAQFGPGPNNTPRARLCDMDIADLDDDGRKEIVVGLSEGLVVALNCECGKLWSTRLPAAPLSLRCVDSQSATPLRVVVGCTDGSVVALDGQGAVVRGGRVSGRPWRIATLQTPAGPLVVLATDKGDVKGYRSGQ
ncbi:MAG: hypothetical protein JW741_01370 [Sedimentisphaerales bacterium]|nr:hypothetical protein [Sedimentisphaerales bacterium]